MQLCRVAVTFHCQGCDLSGGANTCEHGVLSPSLSLSLLPPSLLRLLLALSLISGCFGPRAPDLGRRWAVSEPLRGRDESGQTPIHLPPSTYLETQSPVFLG
eukprot:1282398-Rhodomonas_salina.2